MTRVRALQALSLLLALSLFAALPGCSQADDHAHSEGDGHDHR